MTRWERSPTKKVKVEKNTLKLFNPWQKSHWKTAFGRSKINCTVYYQKNKCFVNIDFSFSFRKILLCVVFLILLYMSFLVLCLYVKLSRCGITKVFLCLLFDMLGCEEKRFILFWSMNDPTI